MGFWGINCGAAIIDGGMSDLLFGKNSLWLPILIITVAYHVILVVLVIEADHKTGLSLSIPETIITHLACLAILLFLGTAARYVPLLDYIRYAMPALAPFERDWLFKARSKTKEKNLSISKEKAAQKAAAVAAAVAATATVDDYEEWLHYLAQPNRPPRKPGVSVQDEYKQWLLARAKSRIVANPKQ